MSLKNLALIAAAVAVMGMAVYLFVQVKASPAEAHHVPTSARPSPAQDHTAAVPPPEAPTATPAVARPAPQAQTPSTPVRTTHEVAPSQAADETDDRRPNLRLDSLMELANKAYDRQDFDEAIAIAGKVLAKDPTNVRMLRVMVSANCIAGDSAVAQEYYVKLPDFDRNQMKTRCDRYGVTLTDPAQ